jgi:alpha-ketoglutarate-dependent taurine dioxygenase
MTATSRAARADDLPSQPLAPFGIILRPPWPEATVADLRPSLLEGLALQHQVVVLRDFVPLSSSAFVAFAERWGPLLAWDFGVLFDLQVHEVPRNYLFTCGNVPYHWDGAFAPSVPGFQLFQCLAAPPPDAGGETLFCNTPEVVAALTPDERARWAEIEIEYQTEKVEHYGGRITARLLGTHPRTGAATIRFAEPFNEGTAPLNPLTVSIKGMTGEDSDHLLRAITERLYAPAVVYAHRWQTGDLVVADNQALLHGRRAFRDRAPRHLQRIHVL